MDTEASFRSVLTTANFNRGARTAIITYCCETLTELAHLPRAELNTSITNMHKGQALVANVAQRVQLNATKITLLHAISLHFLDRIKCNSPSTATDITALIGDDIDEMRTHYNESQHLTAADNLSTITVPKLKSTTWSEFKTAIVETLSRAHGRNSIPLLYIVREDLVGDFSADYDSRDDRLISCISLRGPAFKADNSDVFSILLQHTENTEGYSLIEAQEKRRNGRAAWLSLLSHFEGDTFKERVAQEAGAILRAVIYHGPRKNFNFGDYYSRHTKAHIKLLKADKPMTVQQQIDTFIAGIKCATAQSIVVQISGDPAIRTSFDTYYNAIASRLELALVLSNSVSQSENRNVNKFESARFKKRGGGRDNNDRTQKKKKNNTPFVPELKVYPPDEWKAISRENKAKVRALYIASKNKNNRQGGEFNLTPGNPPQNMQVTPYNMNRNVSQVGYYYPPAPYSNYNIQHVPRAINEVGMPINYGSIPPPPPPPPSPAPSQTPSDVVTGQVGEIGQYFGGYPTRP